MFCEECGMQNSDDAAFCENCGAKLRNSPEQGSAPTQGNVPIQRGQGVRPKQGTTSSMQGNWAVKAPEKKPFSKLFAVIAAEAVVLAAMIFVGVQMENERKEPQNVAERYFVNLANGDWQEAFEQLSFLPEDEFITAENFAKTQAEYNMGIIEEFQVRETQQAADMSGLQNFESYLSQQSGIQGTGMQSLEEEVVIDYRKQGGMNVESYTVSLQSADGNWKVAGSNLVCQDYSIYVPKGAIVSVDGISLGNDYAVREGEEYYQEGVDGYMIPFLFYGIHDIKVTMEGMEDVSETVRVDYGDSRYYLEKMFPQKETLDALIDLGRENMQKIYNAAMEGKNFAAIEELFTTEKETREEIRESYEYLLSEIHEGSIQIENVSFYNMMGEASREGDSVSFGYEYEMQYLEEDGWDDSPERNTAQESGECRFYFVKEDGKWVQTNLGCEQLY